MHCETGWSGAKYQHDKNSTKPKQVAAMYILLSGYRNGREPGGLVKKRRDEFPLREDRRLLLLFEKLRFALPQASMGSGFVSR